jgi:hypothetical protein
MDIDETVSRYRQQAAAAQRRHAAAAEGAAGADARAALTQEELTAEFGVGGLEQAEAMIASLEGQARDEAAEVGRLLAAAGEAT